MLGLFRQLLLCVSPAAALYVFAITQVFGQAALLPNAKQTFVDGTGKPLAGGKVYFYVPGSTNKKTTWSDNTQTSNNTNPVTLDAAGRAVIFGQGAYRQVVQNSAGVQQWDSYTSAYGSSSPSGATGTDTAPVGSIMPFSGFVAPTNWQFSYGQALSRTDYSDLLTAITISHTSVTCTSSSPTLSGWPSTSQIRVGAPVEASCIPTGSTVVSITDASTIVVSNNAVSTTTTTATVFPWGNGDGVTTFNVPDLRGRVPTGADGMGGTLAGRLTVTTTISTTSGSPTATVASANGIVIGMPVVSANVPAGTTVSGLAGTTVTLSGNASATASGTAVTFYAFTGANAAGGTGGANSSATARAELPNVSPTFTGSSSNITNVSGNPPLVWNGNLGGGAGPTRLGEIATGSNALTVIPLGTIQALGSGNYHSNLQASANVNYIIKVKANSTGAGGVVSLGGLFGDIAVDSTLQAYVSGGTNYLGCTTATTSQIGCSKPDGITVIASAGVLSAVAGIASSIDAAGGTSITNGSAGNVLFNNSGVVGEKTVTGTGSVVLGTAPTISAPVISGHPTIEGVTSTGATGVGLLVFNNAPSIVNPTFTGVFTATGLVKNADLANPSTTVSGQTCTLGSSCTVPITGISGLGTGVLSFLAIPSSANLAGAVTDETGSGVLVFNTSPTLATPNITTGFTIGGSATSGNYARGNGTNFVSSAIQAGDLPLASNASGSPSATAGAVKCDGTTITCTSGVITSIGGGGGRTQLTGATTFYVNPSGSSANCNGVTCGAGSDSTGDGSQTTPWATRQHAVSVLSSSYDLNCQTVTIQMADGTYTDTVQFFQPQLFGQCAPTQLIFQGNTTTPTNVLVQPTVGYAYGFFYGFAAQIQYQKLDMTPQLPLGQDMLSIGQGSIAYIGKGMTFGCNGSVGNDIGSYNYSQVYFGNQADATIDVGLCQKTPTATFSGSSSTITLSSTTGVYAGMHIQATNIPIDAYIAAVSSPTVTIACIKTSPCQTSGSGSGASTVISGGGQSFLFAGQGGIIGANSTNGESDQSLILTLGNYPFFQNFAYAGQSGQIQMQAITFVNPGQGHGGCGEARLISSIDTKLMGMPYFPCVQANGAAYAGTAPSPTATTTSGSNSFTVSSATGIQVGNIVNGVAYPTGTWSAGGSTITLSSATGVCTGAKIQGAGLLTGDATTIATLVGTTATLIPCSGSAGSRCVGGYPTYQAGSGVNLTITGCGVPNGSTVTGISGTTITTNQAATATGSQTVIFGVALGAGYTNVNTNSVWE